MSSIFVEVMFMGVLKMNFCNPFLEGCAVLNKLIYMFLHVKFYS